MDTRAEPAADLFRHTTGSMRGLFTNSSCDGRGTALLRCEELTLHCSRALGFGSGGGGRSRHGVGGRGEWSGEAEMGSCLHTRIQRHACEKRMVNNLKLPY